ncbi:hypothetical protein GCM10027040_31520 [Halomonas shantousis]
MPGDLTILPEIGHDIIEPDMGGMQRLVENLKSGFAHDNLPFSVKPNPTMVVHSKDMHQSPTSSAHSRTL